MKAYDHKDLEGKWQKIWEETGVYRTDDSSEKPKQFILDMFPYPSGEGLHVGHPKGYIATDIYARMKRMSGFNVLHPMGWDAFGLPAEQFAIKHKVHPRVAVEKNVARYKEQLSVIGLDYDWAREINTTDPAFYKWTQWIFLKLLEKGLAYESYEPINWCPTCQTGLANEDLDGGKCERCDTPVEKKPMRQWVLKITEYADRMLKDLDLLNWPDSIKEAQRNWIGRSEGAEIDFNLVFKLHPKHNDWRDPKDEKPAHITVFTTRPDTLFGATYLVLAPEHPWVEALWNTEHDDSVGNKSEIEAYVKHAREKTDIERADATKEKTGVNVEGVVALNPVTKEEIPIFVADYVLGGYGTGAVMAVPAHDERDFLFAQKFSLPFREVVVPHRVDYKNPPVSEKEVVTRKNIHGLVRNPKTGKILCLKWKEHPWTTLVVGGVEDGEDIIEAARREILEETGYAHLSEGRILGGEVRADYFAAHKDQNRIAYTSLVAFDLLDEEQQDISADEQSKHEVVWLDEKDVTVELMTHAEMDIWLERMNGATGAYTHSGVLVHSAQFNGKSSEEAKKEITEFAGGRWVTKYRLKEWVFSRQRYWGEPIPVIHCPKDGVVPVPEKELPVLLPDVTSYEPTGTGESPLAAISDWVNTTCPQCGGPGTRETNTMPQWAGSSWYYLRFIDPENNEALIDPKKEHIWDPVDLYVGGDHAVRHLIYARFWHKFLFDIDVVHTLEPFMRLEFLGFILAEDGRKMSKRWGNVINPDDVVKTYGADTLRLYEMFMGPFEQTIAWNTESIIGPRRFLERVWRLRENVSSSVKDTETLETILHKTIKKVTDDIEGFAFNTAISSLMVLSNEMERAKEFSPQAYETFLKLLAPFAPHITEELWHELGHEDSIHLSSWPTYDPQKCIATEVTIAIQINGKVRDTLVVAADISEDEVLRIALERPLVSKWMEGKKPAKTIFVPGKLLSIVLEK